MDFTEQELQDGENLCKDQARYFLTFNRDKLAKFVRDIIPAIANQCAFFVMLKPENVELMGINPSVSRQYGEAIYLLGFYDALQRMGCLDEFKEDYEKEI